MKRSLLFPTVLCLIIGLLCGLILPAPWDQRPPAAVPPAASSTVTDQSAVTQDQTPAFDQKDNRILMSAAYTVLDALKQRNFELLASVTSPEKGLTFTPYSSVDPETDLNFTPAEIRGFAKDETVYSWGFVDGRGNLIEMTIEEYLLQYVYNADYSAAKHIGIDQVLISGNALENVTEAYPGCRFVDFCFPSLDPSMEGMDWCSLKLVFEPGSDGWQLVGVIHGQWTI